jgi:transposase
MAKSKISYTREFKIAILSQVESGTSIAEVARQNGLHPALIVRWRQAYKANPERAFSGSGNPYKEQARIAELERMVGKLYAENEFLKKTLEKMNGRVEEERQRSKHGSDTK